ncbi:hypothetical protein AA14337_2770 [Acetobacter malorum DSM 14337]|uniref:SIR2-like domain-containing protein n=2 Tax=Acetobacter malorum TaxID=178901 RepID=A0ABQ0PXP9_9PROT|nr:SIR2 family protein [Acetobacter malorum]KXV05245.1 hypothetical protein AD930_14120 [Acetobacter malorum]GBQ84131.1 hypothetical protein AA14337_2770 [Acetobacter malorum DSM 14337]
MAVNYGSDYYQGFSKMQINEVIGYIRNASHITFIVGAGASRSAGIPTAPELVKIINSDFNHCLSSVLDEDRTDYGKMMGALSPADRRRLIEPLLAQAKLNWGHVALARIIHAFQVRRILSFNFDFLLEKAAALMGNHLPVYDFGVSPTRVVTGLADKAIFHLHGQSYGLTLLNSDEETVEHAEKLRPLLADSLRNHLTIVIGYSGLADAAFDVMAESFDSNQNLIWLGHTCNAPLHLKPLLEKNYTHYIGGCDFDRSMIEIARGLDCWPIPLIENPPQHALSLLDSLPNFPVGEEQSTEVLGATRDRLKKLVTKWSAGRNDAEKAANVVISGDSKAWNIEGKPLSEEARTLSAWALISQGNKLADEALRSNDIKKKEKFADAYGKFSKALEIKIDNYDALNNWGTTLAREARTCTGKLREQKLSEAIEKFSKAIEIKPNMHRALFNWGIALVDEAKDLKGTTRSQKFAQAIEKFKEALEAGHDRADALNHWGSALAEDARGHKGTKRAERLREAAKKFEEAFSINPRKSKFIENWAATLLMEAGDTNNRERENALCKAFNLLYAIKKKDGKAIYNLACALALKGKYFEALNELEACLKDDTLPDILHIEADPDLIALHAEPRFEALLERQRSK